MKPKGIKGTELFSWQGMTRLRKALCLFPGFTAGLIIVFCLFYLPHASMQAQRTGGKIFAPGFTPLCQVSIKVAGNSIGPCTFPPPPTGTQWRKIIIYDYVSGYGGGGDTVGYRFNGDTGSNYRYECNTMAAGGITFAAGTNTAATAAVMKLAPADSTLNRNFQVELNNSSEVTEKTAVILSVTGTGAVGTQAAFDLCNGAWVSPAATSITSITSVTLTNNMGANSGFAAFGLAW